MTQHRRRTPRHKWSAARQTLVLEGSLSGGNNAQNLLQGALPMYPVRCLTHVSWAGPCRFGGRDGIRTHDLLIANEEKSMIRHGATIT